MANPTAAVIIGLARNLLRSSDTSDVPVIQDSFMLAALSDGNLKWANVFKQSGDEPIVFQREFGITLIADTTLAANVATTDITITLASSASLPASGYVALWTQGMVDIVAYTSNNKATGVLSGITGLGFAHSSGDTVAALYVLPSDFGSFRSNDEYGDGVQLNGLPLSYQDGPPFAGYFSEYDDGTNKYVWFPVGSTGVSSVWYDKVSADISSLSDIVDVPLDWRMFLVWHLVAFAYVGREGDINLMKLAQMESERVLQQALQVRNVGKKIKTRPFGRAVRDFTTINGAFVPLSY